jgi:hypothetical protein
MWFSRVFHPDFRSVLMLRPAILRRARISASAIIRSRFARLVAMT